VPADRVADEERVYRRIPRAAPWFEEPDTITSANFKLDRRRGDLGLSVYRASVVTAADVLAKAAATLDSFVASARVADIRALRSINGEPLELDVVVVDDEDDAGHAEIRGPSPGTLSPAASKALRDLFSRSQF
jgi:hypothetical protein